MPVELTLAALATADLCLKYGKSLIEVYSNFRHAEEEIKERVLLIGVIWFKTKTQLNYLRGIWNVLEQSHQEAFQDTLNVLRHKLDVTHTKLRRIQDSNGDIHRLKYPLFKSHLDKAIKSLKEWQAIYDPTWVLIMRIDNILIDQALAQQGGNDQMTSSARNLRSALQEGTGKEIFLPHEGIDTTSLRSVRFSDAQIMIREGSQYVIDPVARNSDIRPEIQTGDVRTLASKLRTANPLLYGLLECRGAVKFLDTEQKITSYGIVFKFPKDMVEPKSLRWLLVHDGCSLSAKIGLAKHLAKALSYVHTYGFVHKSIRPETILVFSSGDTSAPFLLGFERFRLAEGRTWRRGDRMWKDLYRHPSRQGVTPEEDYVMQHDIYSLGVCLLEVGLWQSFLAYPSEGVPDSEPIPQIGQGTASPSRAKDELLSMARNQLPRLMGDKYTRVVINCLTCLDEDNLDFQDENQFLDADGVLIGVRYIQKILMALDEISV